MDRDLRKKHREAESDPENESAKKSLQAETARSFPLKDALYLEEYLSIVESLLERDLSISAATEKLEELNSKYTDYELGPNTRKSAVLGSYVISELEDYESWVPSSASC